MNIAVLLSGGTGSRLGGDVPKQYLKAGDFMVITYAIKPLLVSARIDAIVIVADEMWCEQISEEIDRLDPKHTAEWDKKQILFADPGENRQLSILSGMERAMEMLVSKFDAFEEFDNAGSDNILSENIVSRNTGHEKTAPEKDGQNTVFIHDAARPLLRTKQIEDCYKALPDFDGVMPVLPMKDTVYYSKDGKSVDSLLERECIFAGQAPELFLFAPYYEATKALLPDAILKIKGSTEVAIQAGMNIAMIPGDEGNYKITTMPDLERFREGLGRR